MSHTTDEHLQRNMKLATKLLRLRKATKMSMREVETRSGVSKAMLCRLERGFSNPTLATMKKLSKFYGIQPAEWFE